MKKFLAVLVMLSLVVGSVFAQLTVGGQARGGLYLFQMKVGALNGIGPYTSDKTVTGPFAGQAWGPYDGTAALTGAINAQYANAEGTVGAKVQFTAWNGGVSANYVFAWWQPISMLRMQIGNLGDAFGTDNGLVGWSYHGEVQEMGVATKMHTGDAYVDAGNSYGLRFDITPMDMLAINIAFRDFQDLASNDAVKKAFANFYRHTFAQVIIKITNIGDFYLSYDGGYGALGEYTVTSYDSKFDTLGGSVVNDTNKYLPANDNGKIAFAFHLTAIDKLDASLGFKYTINGKTSETLTYVNPLHLALGLKYDLSDSFGIKSAMSFAFLGGYTKHSSQSREEYNGGSDYYVYDTPFKFGITVTPYLKMDIANFYFNLGLTLDKNMTKYGPKVLDENKYDPVQVGWLINPVVEKNVGGISFYFGVIVKSTPTYYASKFTDGANKVKNVIDFSIPVGFNVYF